MTTEPKEPRPWWVHVLIGAAIMATLVAGLFVAMNTGNGNDATQDSAATSAPQEQAPDYPEFTSPPATEVTDEPTASPTPSASPTPAAPKGDDNRRKAYDKHFANNPAYDCPDGRNSGLGINNQDQFVPCINGSLRLELGTRGTVTLYSSTTRSASVEHKVSTKATAPKPGVTGVDWVIRQSTFGTDELGEFYRLRYFANPDLRRYAVYYRIGNGSYKLLEADSRKFYTDTYYQVVVFWNDPELPRDDAPLPPFFAWSSAEKPFSS